MPEQYDVEDLNKYFERMNSSGRSLEQHENLKVELLKNPELTGDDDKLLCTQIWNLVSQMDKPILHNADDNKEGYRAKILEILDALTKSTLGEISKIIKQEVATVDNGKSIQDVESSSKKPESKVSSSSHSVVSFSEFLLLVLNLQGDGSNNTDGFYNTSHLLERFNEMTSSHKIKEFYKDLFLYRLLLDYFVIRIQKNEDAGDPYTLAFKNDQDDLSNKYLIKYESMLYVSTSFYLWLRPLLAKLKEYVQNNKIQELKIDDFLKELKSIDNERFNDNKPKFGTYRKEEGLSEFSYDNGISRYWFWRLDYYLWEANENEKLDNKDPVIPSYVFRINRSIEHLYPQNSEKQNEKWVNEKDYVHRFGNLAMISQGFNSEQSNDPINVKFSRIKNQIDNKQLQSIKLYKMYSTAKGNDPKWTPELMKWTPELMKAHESEMIEILQKSFETDF